MKRGTKKLTIEESEGKFIKKQIAKSQRNQVRNQTQQATAKAKTDKKQNKQKAIRTQKNEKLGRKLQEQLSIRTVVTDYQNRLNEARESLITQSQQALKTKIKNKQEPLNKILAQEKKNPGSSKFSEKELKALQKITDQIVKKTEKEAKRSLDKELKKIDREFKRDLDSLLKRIPFKFSNALLKFLQDFNQYEKLLKNQRNNQAYNPNPIGKNYALFLNHRKELLSYAKSVKKNGLEAARESYKDLIQTINKENKPIVSNINQLRTNLNLETKDVLTNRLTRLKNFKEINTELAKISYESKPKKAAKKLKTIEKRYEQKEKKIYSTLGKKGSPLLRGYLKEFKDVRQLLKKTDDTLFNKIDANVYIALRDDIRKFMKDLKSQAVQDALSKHPDLMHKIDQQILSSERKELLAKYKNANFLGTMSLTIYSNFRKEIQQFVQDAKIIGVNAALKNHTKLVSDIQKQASTESKELRNLFKKYNLDDLIAKTNVMNYLAFGEEIRQFAYDLQKMGSNRALIKHSDLMLALDQSVNKEYKEIKSMFEKNDKTKFFTKIDSSTYLSLRGEIRSFGIDLQKSGFEVAINKHIGLQSKIISKEYDQLKALSSEPKLKSLIQKIDKTTYKEFREDIQNLIQTSKSPSKKEIDNLSDKISLDQLQKIFVKHNLSQSYIDIDLDTYKALRNELDKFKADLQKLGRKEAAVQNPALLTNIRKVKEERDIDSFLAMFEKTNADNKRTNPTLASLTKSGKNTMPALPPTPMDSSSVRRNSPPKKR